MSHSSACARIVNLNNNVVVSRDLRDEAILYYVEVASGKEQERPRNDMNSQGDLYVVFPY